MSLFGNLGGATTSAPATNTLFGGTAGTTTGTTTGTSLFGTPTANTTATAPATGGLFGAKPASTQATATPSLFGGGTATATAPATGGLFGSTPAATTGTAATQAGTTGGLFGTATATNTAAKPSLFGTGTTTTTTQPATGGLFGNLGTTTTNQQPATGTTGGLFGGLGSTSTTTAAKPSLFGAPAATTQQPAATMGAPGTASQSLFGATNNAAPANNSTPVNQTSGAFFDSLLARNKKQAEGETALGDLPSLQLGLGDLRQRLKKVGPQTQGRPVDGKAHYFLAASGVDPGAAVRDLGAFSLGARAERQQTVYGARDEVDVETYLSNLQQKTTLSMISDGLERSVRDFDSFLEENVTMEWEAQRKRIYQHFGIQPRNEAERASGSAREGFGRSRRRGSQTPRATQNARSGLQRSIIGTPARIGSHAPEFSDVEKDAGTSASTFGSVEDRFLREKQEKLSEQVRYINDARQQKEPVYVCRDFADLESRSGDKHAPHIVEAYRAMMEIVGENPHLDQVPKERAFAKKYLDPSTLSKNAVDMRKQILDGANRYLEKQFFDEVNALIAKYPQDANLGGKPDVVSKIKAFIRLRIARKTLVPDNTDLQSVNGEYIWAVVFYLLRAGFVNEAATYVNDMQHHFRSIDRTFPGYINSYASSEDRRLKRQMQDRCTSEYNQRIRNAPEGTIDPFRMACYKIIGRCDVSNRSLDNLNTDVNDWIWLQFNLARESAKELEIAGESYGLPELQASIKEIGLKHFPKSPAEDTNGSFGMFFFMQILAGMFEQAIAYLYPFSYVDAVHFAIALSYYGLLRPADAFTTGNELLSSSTRGLPQINFGRMLGYYTRDFRAANAASAVDYLILICLNADDAAGNGQAQAQLCHEALRELVLESREFSKLIGDIKPDGHRIPGVIEQRGSLIALGHEQEFVTQITHQAATYADDNGRTTDAVLLYHLAGDYDTVIAIVSRALSEAVSLEIGEDPLRLVPVKPRAEGEVANAQQGTSLSLAAIDDPVELARTMMSMYERDAMFLNHIRDQNRIACNLLLRMSEIKEMIQRNDWAKAIDVIRSLGILPTDDCMGDPAKIRSYASKFSSLAQPVAINVPNLLMWTIICCTRQRERLLTGQFVGNAGTAREMLARLKQITVDLTTYTSMLRYRLPPHLTEALARASAD